MTKYAIVLTLSLTATNALAGAVYGTFGEGNGDLYDRHGPTAGRVAIQPGIGDRVDVYHGLASGNGDLFNVSRQAAPAEGGPRPDIYQGFQPNVDLHY
ncbi:hypothetical protein [Thiorhodococcus minor]|uniref:Uncharacterized protein n=1 Tax=Thiorhodococcus minor TaxID=57489 RepID=A0A6M0K573_9GAMM|nr:hypothetical protein [Thiorhodococcus minor]NEV64902.1 hypothetical protein [Thiorhodococcus minor]